MAVVNKVDKKVQMDQWDAVRFQILTHCYISRIPVSEADLDCLTLLSIKGEQELTTFCTEVHAQNIFRSAQTVRNAISKAEKKNLIVKEGRSKKRIAVNPEIKVVTEGNILLDYKFLALASDQK